MRHGVWAAQEADLQGEVSLAAAVAVAGEVLCAVAGQQLMAHRHSACLDAGRHSHRANRTPGRSSALGCASCPLPSRMVWPFP